MKNTNKIEMKCPSYICIDADGTLFTHAYPDIGKDIGAVPILTELLEQGHKLILFTMRSGEPLQEAVDWCSDNDIQLYGVNTNPTQHHWTKSHKAYANLYIDDAALGCPLRNNPDKSDRPFVDWVAVRYILIDKGYLPEKKKRQPRKHKCLDEKCCKDA